MVRAEQSEEKEVLILWSKGNLLPGLAPGLERASLHRVEMAFEHLVVFVGRQVWLERSDLAGGLRHYKPFQAGLSILRRVPDFPCLAFVFDLGTATAAPSMMPRGGVGVSLMKLRSHLW